MPIALITGAKGFIGRALSARMLSEGWQVRALVRASSAGGLDAGPGVESIDSAACCPQTFAGVEVVVHLAARVHVMRETARNPLAEFLRVNLSETERLASMAAAAGVRRFVYLSTIGVNGKVTAGRPFTAADEPNPHNPYAVSKLAAEEALRRIAAESGMEVVILRPPIVYGPQNPGNFLTLLQVVAKGVPLPLARVENRRSMIYLGNLVDAIVLCARHHAAAGRTYLVRDGEDLSTPGLVRGLASALGCGERLFPFPAGLLRAAGRVTGKDAAVERLTGSLCLDDGAIRGELGWIPPYTVEQGLRETARWFKGLERVGGKKH